MSKWIMEYSKNWDPSYRDEDTGRFPWGVTNTEDEGSGYEMFDTKQEAMDYIRQMKIWDKQDA